MRIASVVSSVLGSPFARQAGVNFVKVAGLYSLYAFWFIVTDYPGAPYVERLIRAGAGASFLMAVLTGAAVFAAAASHFDVFGERVPETRKRDWGCLALYAVAACVLMEVGIPLADWLMEAVGAPAVEYENSAPWGNAMRRLVPVAVAAFVVVSGVAGAAVGRMTELSSPRRRRMGRWLGGAGFVLLFMFSLVLWGEIVVVYELPLFLIPFVPPVLPFGAACWLVRSQGYGVLEVVGLEPRGRSLDAEAVMRLVRAVVEERREGAPRIEEVARNPEELEMARFLKWFRQVAAPAVATSEAERKEMVAFALRTAPAPEPKRPPHRWWRPIREHVGEFGVSWAALSVGLATAGLLGGVPPSLAPALTVGGLGAVAQQVHGLRRKASS